MILGQPKSYDYTEIQGTHFIQRTRKSDAVHTKGKTCTQFLQIGRKSDAFIRRGQNSYNCTKIQCTRVFFYREHGKLMQSLKSYEEHRNMMHPGTKCIGCTQVLQIAQKNDALHCRSHKAWNLMERRGYVVHPGTEFICYTQFLEVPWNF